MSSKLEDLKYLFKTIALNLFILELHIIKVFIPSELEGLIAPSMPAINENTKNTHYNAVLFLKYKVHDCFALTEYHSILSHPLSKQIAIATCDQLF